MRGYRPHRASWDVLAAAASSLGMSLREGNAPHPRWLHLADGWGAEVSFSTDMRWYRLALPLARGTVGDRPERQKENSCGIKLTRTGLMLARPASEGGDLHLLADIPASTAEVLAASLAVWRADYRQATALITEREEKAENSEVLPVAPAEADAIRAVEAFLRDVGTDWQMTQGEAGTWRLVRRPGASRGLPPVCQLSFAGPVTSVTTMIRLGSTSPAGIPVAARSLFLLQLNAGRHVAGRLLPDDGAELRAALPTSGLQSAHLSDAFHALVAAHKFSALELQALGEEALAVPYLRLQGNQITFWIKQRR